MPPLIPDPARIVPFESEAAFYAWLEAHHAVWPELWLKFYKKGSGKPTLSYAEAVRAALCWGWIDGIKKTLDAESYILRFTPRRSRSIWSQINTRHVAALETEGLMQPQGRAHVDAAKADGRWDKAYPGGGATEMPEDFLVALEASPAAKAAFETLNRTNRFAMMFRITQPKKAETRQRKIAEFVAMLERGEKLY